MELGQGSRQSGTEERGQWQLTHVKGSSSDAASAAAASPVATSTLRSIVFANCCLLFVVLSNRLRFASAQPELSTALQLSLFLFLSLALHLTSLDDAPSLSLPLALYVFLPGTHVQSTSLVSLATWSL